MASCSRDAGKGGGLAGKGSAQDQVAALLSGKGRARRAAATAPAGGARRCSGGDGKDGAAAIHRGVAKPSVVGEPVRLVLWHNPRIDDARNSALVKELEAKHFKVTRKRKHADAAAFLKDPSRTNGKKWLVITSGKDGEALVTAAHDAQSVGAIIVFCEAVDFHRQWARKFSKVRRVTKAVSEFRRLVTQLGNLMVIAQGCGGLEGHVDEKNVMASLNMILPGVAGFSKFEGLERGYAVVERGEGVCASLVFRCVVGKLSETQTSRGVKDSRIGKELEACLRSGVCTEHWNDTWMADEWITDNGRNVTPASLGQKLSLVYTSDYVYGRLNARLASADLIPIMTCLSAWHNEVKHAPQGIKHSGAILFRGLKRTHVHLADYPDNAACYWTPFSSCSEKQHVATQYAGPDGVIFHITRLTDLNERHPNIDVGRNPDWSHYGKDEHEVLLFPYLHLQVERKEMKGMRQWIYLREKPSVFMARGDDINSAVDHYLDLLLDPRIVSAFRLKAKKLFDAFAKPGLDQAATHLSMVWFVREAVNELQQIAYLILESSIVSKFVDVRAVMKELQTAVESKDVLVAISGEQSCFESLLKSILNKFSQSLREILKGHLATR